MTHVSASSHLRHVLVGAGGVVRESVVLDRAKVLIWPSLYRSAIITALVVAAIAAGTPENALALGIGSLFVALAGEFQPIGRRWRLMLWTLLWSMVGAFLGGLVSDTVVIGVIVSAGVALVCGFVAVGGAGAGIASLLTLVVFTVFCGIPVNPVSDLHTTLLIGLGGLVQFVAIALPAFVRHPAAFFDAGEQPAPLIARIRPHVKLSDPMMRHGIRLAVAIAVATAVSHTTALPNHYWIPMTVAWMSRPDAHGTVTKVVGRILGTIGGVLLSLLLLDATGMPLDSYGFAAVVGIGAVIALVFIWAEYPLAVVGVTVFVIALLALLGESSGTSSLLRIVDTLIAGVITVACSFLLRPKPTT